jgi:hypothetical protein
MSICSIESCGKPHAGLGYCSSHYKRLKKYGDPLAPLRRVQKRPPGMVCTICGGKVKGYGLCEPHLLREQRLAFWGEPNLLEKQGVIIRAIPDKKRKEEVRQRNPKPFRTSGFGELKKDVRADSSRRRARKAMSDVKVCDMCGTDNNLYVHHRDENPFNNKRSNLQKLCAQCHNVHHNSYQQFFPGATNSMPRLRGHKQGAKICKVCGKIFERKRISNLYIEPLSNFKNKKVCGIKCRHIAQRRQTFYKSEARRKARDLFDVKQCQRCATADNVVIVFIDKDINNCSRANLKLLCRSCRNKWMAEEKRFMLRG